jgi:hypothetical protein
MRFVSQERGTGDDPPQREASVALSVFFGFLTFSGVDCGDRYDFNAFAGVIGDEDNVLAIVVGFLYNIIDES